MNVELATICCRACMYGYDRMVGSDVAPILSEVGDETLISVGTSHALVIEMPERRLVVFPGTESEWDTVSDPAKFSKTIRDWLENAKCRLVSDDRYGLAGRQHRGFLSELQAVSPELGRDLINRRDTLGDKPIVLTGHSQGGAIAAIATAALPLVGIPVAETFTFAAPRPGDAEFADSFIKEGVGVPVWRMEYGSDIVPHLPFHPDISLVHLPTEWLDYQHVGQLVYGRPNNGSFIATNSYALTHAARRSRLLNDRELWFEHHHLPHYLDLLEALPK